MDEVFFKSALPAQDSFVLEDTSLALPAEPTPRSSTKLDSNERSLRVHHQVQLTLARKARKPISNGGVHLQKSTARSFDATDGYLPIMKVNESGISNRSLSTHRTQTPSRRVEVSPTPSPDLHLARFNYSTISHGMQTLPRPSYSHMMGTLLHRPQGSTFRRYAFSEAPRGSRPHASVAAHGSYHRRSLRQTTATQPVFASAGFQQNGDYSSRWSQKQSIVKRDQHTVQGPSGDMMLSPIQPDAGFSWLPQMRKEGRRSLRMSSYPPSVTSMEVDMGGQVGVELPVQQIQNVMTLNSANKPPEMSLERAVKLLSQDNEETLISAASYIQNQCFLSADAKNMMYYLRGIRKLLELLNIDSEEVQRVAAGALRNVVYQSSKNKMEVKEIDGLSVISQALRSSRDMETRCQLSGLLWNLSSHDLLKDHLSRESLSVITQSVLVPSSGISEGENPKDELLADNDSFYNATGCLRNLSSAGPDVRRAMRQCENLIDSLVYYIRGAVANFKTDDKSTENCVCILHNLSYQIESEVPQNYTQDVRASRQHLVPRPMILGCFAYRSAKIPEYLEHQRPLLEEKANPHGTEWLRSPITIRMYLSLVACSMRPCTQEAAIGALQNITAGCGELTEAIAFTIVERENGLQHVKKMLEEGENNVKKTAISLIRNISRYQELHSTIVNQLLSEMVAMLPSDDSGTVLPNEVTTSLLQILINLSQTETKNVKAIVNQGALPKVISMSKADNGYGPSRAAQVACVLLHTIWKHSDLHGALRRSGYKKSDFINPRMTKVVNS
ncbi:plakophilin-2 isoform X2 [Parambassis ranga]|uniref:Plakophilin-2 isoform X2 n=1 Tax=Parambassis ranga TaxID=210632 RepID=A0A6P7HAT5_9TELE|nr:plakophilin-2 isoform X2 [Parambassis ranga]